MNLSQITNLLATNILNWKPLPDAQYKDTTGSVVREFKPFENINDAWLIIEYLKRNYGVKTAVGTGDFLLEIFMDQESDSKEKSTLVCIKQVPSKDMPKQICLGALTTLLLLQSTTSLEIK